MAKSKRKLQEINASTMADIAFLLLVFFLVTTTIDADKGITVKLPVWTDVPPPPVDINQRNVLPVLVNSHDQLLVKGDLITVDELKEKAKIFLTNNGANPRLSDNPDKAVISLKNDRGTSYDIYIQVQNEIKAAYHEIWDDESMIRFGKKFDNLELENQRIIFDAFPRRFSEAEPEG